VKIRGKKQAKTKLGVELGAQPTATIKETADGSPK